VIALILRTSLCSAWILIWDFVVVTKRNIITSKSTTISIKLMLEIPKKRIRILEEMPTIDLAKPPKVTSLKFD
jgi:hypothetical protein